MEGWVKLHRCLIDSYVFSNPVTLKIWIWILLRATRTKRFASVKIGAGFQDVELNPGDLIFGRFKAEEQLNIDGSTIYKHIHKLEESNNITIKSNNHYTIITVCNWDTYQDIEEKKEQPKDNQMTTEEQQSNNRVTTEEHKQESKEYIERKESKEEIIFDEFRKLYPGTKRGNKTEFENFKKKTKDWKVVLPILQTSINGQMQYRSFLSSKKMFVPQWKALQTWINNRCWEEETKVNTEDNVISTKSSFVA